MLKRCCKWVLLVSLSLSQSLLADVIIEDGWVRAVPPVSRGTAGYFNITNTGDEAVVLTGAKASFARHTMLHSMAENEQGLKEMKHLDVITIAAGETVTFVPGGLHLMIMGLKTVPQEGETVQLCFQFDNLPKKCAPFAVRQDL